MDSFVPTTYRMDVLAEREEFERNYRGETSTLGYWITFLITHALR